MNTFGKLTAVALLTSAAALALAATEGNVAEPGAAAQGISKEQAIEMALRVHPGEVEKAYKETKRGVETWEVKIQGDDGYEWELYYAVADGELIKEEKDD
jgi:uncharacterized membrane protein YkoI